MYVYAGRFPHNTFTRGGSSSVVNPTAAIMYGANPFLVVHIVGLLAQAFCHNYKLACIV